MTHDEIIKNLCAYDKRRKDFIEDTKQESNACCCDNCLYGREKLANEILKLKEKIEELKFENKELYDNYWSLQS